jgi:hypothetical protein
MCTYTCIGPIHLSTNTAAHFNCILKAPPAFKFSRAAKIPGTGMEHKELHGTNGFDLRKLLVEGQPYARSSCLCRVCEKVQLL